MKRLTPSQAAALRRLQKRRFRAAGIGGILSILLPATLAAADLFGLKIENRTLLYFVLGQFFALSFLLWPLFAGLQTEFERVANMLEEVEIGIHCRLIGDADEAVHYVAKKCEDPDSNVLALRDTHFRGEDHQRYDSKTLELLRTSIKNWLSRSLRHRFITVTGTIVDDGFIQTIVKACADVEDADRNKCYRLPQSGPVMNFLIIDYTDRHSEVLFGWGRYGISLHTETVFSSESPELVAEFISFYNSLVHGQNPAPIARALIKH